MAAKKIEENGANADLLDRADKHLAKFAKIAMSATAPIRISKSITPWHTLPADQKKNIVKFASSMVDVIQKISRRNNGNNYHGNSNLADGIIKEVLGSKPAIDDANALVLGPESVFAKAAAAIQSMAKTDEEAIADEMAKTIVVAFDKGAERYLAFPPLGEGVRISKAKISDKTIRGLAHWKTQKANEAAHYADMEINGRHQQRERDNVADDVVESGAHHLMFGHLGTLGFAPNAIPLSRDVKSVAASEKRIPSCETLSRYIKGVDRKTLLAAFAGIRKKDPNRFNNNYNYHSSSNDLSEGFSILFGKTPGAWVQNPDETRHSAAIDIISTSAAALCCSMGDSFLRFVKQDGSVSPDFSRENPLSSFWGIKASSVCSTSNGYNRFHKSEFSGEVGSDYPAPVALAYRLACLMSSIPAKNSLFTKEAEAFCKAFERKVLDIVEISLERATLRQNAWLESNGLLSPWIAAHAQEAAPSPKSINWIVANPGNATLSSSSNPLETFAGTVSRPLGCSGSTSDEIVSNVRLALSEMGLESDGLDFLLSSKELTSALTNELVSAVKTKGDDRRMSMACAEAVCRASNAAAEISKTIDGGAPVATRACLLLVKNILENKSVVTSPSNDSLLGDFPSVNIATIEEAQTLIKRGEAKRALSSRIFSQAVLRSVDTVVAREREPVEKGTASVAESLFRKSIIDSFSGSAAMWEQLPEGFLWGSLAYRRWPGAAVAMDDAIRNCGPAGRLAVESSIVLGINDAVSGNDLVGKVRDGIKSRFGIGDGAWKALLKDPDSYSKALESMTRAATQTTSSEGLNTGSEQFRIHARRSLSDFGATASAVAFSTQFNASPSTRGILLDVISHHTWAQDFLDGIKPMDCPSLDSSRFFLAEALAKKSRLPDLFRICISRIEEHVKRETSKREAEIKGATPLPKDAKTPKELAYAAFGAEWSQISDWLQKSEMGLWQNLPQKLSWAALWRGQQDWHHDVQAQIASGKFKKAGWRTHVGRLAEGGWEAVELDDGTALADEGKSMRHCVSSYSGNCRSGRCRIFSVRFQGERVCTLELSPHEPDGRRIESFSGRETDDSIVWKQTQNSGVCNAAVTNKAAIDFCKSVAVKYTEAYKVEALRRKAEIALKAKERRSLEKTLSMVDPLNASQDQKEVKHGKEEANGEKDAEPAKEAVKKSGISKALSILGIK